MPKFSKSSLGKLSTCDERLQKLFNEVIKHFDCKVTEGHRTIEQQIIYVNEGKSKTMNSKHLTEPSLAVDVYPFPIDFKDTKRFYYFAGFVKGIASQLEIPIRWGGDWDSDTDLHDQNFNDLPHFEIKE